MKHEHFGITSLEVIELVAKMMRLYEGFTAVISCQDGVWSVSIYAE